MKFEKMENVRITKIHGKCQISGIHGTDVVWPRVYGLIMLVE
jgi:hypothetical protein